MLSGGLGGLLKQFQDNGQGQVANSWVGTGPNQDISESDLAKSIGSDDIDTLAQHTGLSRDELLAGLRRELPGAIDELTPDGRVPSRAGAVAAGVTRRHGFGFTFQTGMPRCVCSRLQSFAQIRKNPSGIEIFRL